MGTNLFCQNPALRLLSIPATESTKIVVEDRQNWLSKAHFDVRLGSSGLYDLMRWLVQKARAYEGKVVRRQRKCSRRAGSKSEEVSAIRERLAVRVLIKNAVCLPYHRYIVSCCFTDIMNLRSELRRSFTRRVLNLADSMTLTASSGLRNNSGVAF
jgi:hypothetical protein